MPGTLHDVDFMVKDSKRFADSGGWGWAAFKYDAASDTFTPATTADQPPQGNDAKCGFACHTIVKTRDYVFTDYGKRERPSWPDTSRGTGVGDALGRRCSVSMPRRQAPVTRSTGIVADSWMCRTSLPRLSSSKRTARDFRRAADGDTRCSTAESASDKFTADPSPRTAGTRATSR